MNASPTRLRHGCLAMGLGLLALLVWGPTLEDPAALPAAALPGAAVAQAATPQPTSPPAAASPSTTEIPAALARALPVEASGWIKVPLDPDLRARLSPEGRDLRLRDAGGAELGYWLVRDAPTVPRPVAPEAIALAEEPGGTWISFDLGPEPGPHVGFQFELAGTGLVSGLRLEGSADGQAPWQPLATADLFRLGEAAGLSQTTLRYPATEARYLRLWWPEEAGEPAARGLALEPAPSQPAVEDTLSLTWSATGGGAGSASYAVELPGPGLPLNGFQPEWEGAGTLGYRLLAPAEGRWRVLAEGSLARPAPGQAWPTIPLPGLALGTPRLRLELATGGTGGVELSGLTAVSPRDWLVFYAPQAGEHALAYGRLGLAPAPEPPGQPAVPLAEMAELAPGPEAPDAAAGALAPLNPWAAPAPELAFAASWPVLAGVSAPAPGEPLRLPLPIEVYSATLAGLDDLRLLAVPAGEDAEAQLAYLRYTEPEPLLVAESVAAPQALPVPPPVVGAPASGGPDRSSRIQVPLPSTLAPFTLLELSTPAQVFDRSFEVEAVIPGRPGIEARRVALAPPERWICPGAAALPCRAAVELGGPLPVGAEPRIELTIRDGDDAPLPSVEARVWRREDGLVFVWPGTSSIHLVAGAEGLGAPRYDLEARRDELLARAGRAVGLGAAESGSPSAPSAAGDRAERFLLLGALVLAGLLLVGLLARLLRPAPTRG